MALYLPDIYVITDSDYMSLDAWMVLSPFLLSQAVNPPIAYTIHVAHHRPSEVPPIRLFVKAGDA